MENKPYLPSNGTEGVIFMEKFCDKCYKRYNCTILIKSLVGNQPKQWVYTNENKPTCTSFNPNKPKAKNNPKKDINQSLLF